MFEIPDFLKPENNTKPPSELSILMEQYRERFHGGITTVGFDFTDEELCRTLKKCLKRDKTFEEVMGIVFHEDEDR